MEGQKRLTEWVGDQDEEGRRNLPNSSEVRQVMSATKERQPAITLLEQVLHEPNLRNAWEQVKRNRGAPGIDGVTIEEFGKELPKHIDNITTSVLNGTYIPSPVRRKDIEKSGGGYRMLGIPTICDRLLAQAISQVLTPILDPTFSESSFGFRPGRSAHQAINHAKAIISEGYTWVVDIDISKFFDNVNHDILMERLSRRIEDKELLKLIREFLNAGVMHDGVVIEQVGGMPQGSPLSPLLSNFFLDELDKELEQRGHRFSRYADDCNIYVKSERAAKRVMASIKVFIEDKLRLRVNAAKSAVDRPWKRTFLGYSFLGGVKTELKIRVAKKSIKKLKEKVRGITKRNRGVSLNQVIKELNQYLKGWLGFFRLTQTPSILKELDGWIRRKLRCYIFKQWKNPKKRLKELRKLGAEEPWSVAYSGKGVWRLSLTKQLNLALNSEYFHSLGLFSLYQQWRDC